MTDIFINYSWKYNFLILDMIFSNIFYLILEQFDKSALLIFVKCDTKISHINNCKAKSFFFVFALNEIFLSKIILYFNFITSWSKIISVTMYLNK